MKMVLLFTTVMDVMFVDFVYDFISNMNYI